MEIGQRIEGGLQRALAYATSAERPPKISEAMRYAVFPGGARVRPRLCLAVSEACGGAHPAAASAAATAVELLHCASLIHDDLPCFDNADLRRGKPSVHSVWGEPVAVLAGDALIVLAFETLARECATTPTLIGPLVAVVGRAVGMPNGIVAGQAWESEAQIPLEEYHRAKTGALFMGATAAGAIAAGGDPQTWLPFANALGSAYQVADDLRDVAGSIEETGKECGQDAANGRPNAAGELGAGECLKRLRALVDAAVAAIPECPGDDTLKQLVRGEAKRLTPSSLARYAVA